VFETDVIDYGRRPINNNGWVPIIIVAPLVFPTIPDNNPAHLACRITDLRKIDVSPISRVGDGGSRVVVGVANQFIGRTNPTITIILNRRKNDGGGLCTVGYKFAINRDPFIIFGLENQSSRKC